MTSLPRPCVGVVDYGMGNRRSVEKALQHVGASPVVSGDPEVLNRTGGLVVPGVGAFPQGMHSLRERGLDEFLTERARAGVPVLGICLGMQLLFEASNEVTPTDGLGLLRGQVTALRTNGLRLPHIGWNDVSFERACRLTAGLAGDRRAFYHVHSYAARPERGEDVVGTCEYGERFATIVASDSIFGVQFHPEKSSADGLAILAAFVSVATGRSAADATAVGTP